MPNIKHLRKSLAWLDWRWRLQLLCQNIPSHRRRFWCMDLRGRFKFWHAWHTNFGSRHSVQVDKAPGTLQKMVDATMMSVVGEPWKSPFIGFQCYKKFCGFFLLYSHFRRFQKMGENSPGLVGSTDCLWPLHWRIHSPGRRFVFNRKDAPESSVRHIESSGDFGALTEKTLGTKLSKGNRFFLWPVNSMRSTHCNRKISYCSSFRCFSGHPKRLFARLIKKPAGLQFHQNISRYL